MVRSITVSTSKSELPQPFMSWYQKSQSVTSAIFSWLELSQAHPDARRVGIDLISQGETCQRIKTATELLYKLLRFHLSEPLKIKQSGMIWDTGI